MVQSLPATPERQQNGPPHRPDWPTSIGHTGWNCNGSGPDQTAFLTAISDAIDELRRGRPERYEEKKAEKQDDILRRFGDILPEALTLRRAIEMWFDMASWCRGRPTRRKRRRDLSDLDTRPTKQVRRTRPHFSGREASALEIDCEESSAYERTTSDTNEPTRDDASSDGETARASTYELTTDKRGPPSSAAIVGDCRRHAIRAEARPSRIADATPTHKRQSSHHKSKRATQIRASYCSRLTSETGEPVIDISPSPDPHISPGRRSGRHGHDGTVPSRPQQADGGRFQGPADHVTVGVTRGLSVQSADGVVSIGRARTPRSSHGGTRVRRSPGQSPPDHARRSPIVISSDSDDPLPRRNEAAGRRRREDLTRLDDNAMRRWTPPDLHMGIRIEPGLNFSGGIRDGDTLEVNVGNNEFHARAFGTLPNITLPEIRALPMDTFCLRVRGIDRPLLPLQFLIALRVVEKQDECGLCVNASTAGLGKTTMTWVRFWYHASVRDCRLDIENSIHRGDGTRHLAPNSHRPDDVCPTQDQWNVVCPCNEWSPTAKVKIRKGAFLVVAPRYLLGAWEQEFQAMFGSNGRAKIYVQHPNFPSQLNESILVRGGGSQSRPLPEEIETYPLHWVAVVTSPASFRSHVGDRGVITWREVSWDEPHLHVSTDSNNHVWMRGLNKHQLLKPSITLNTASVFGRGPRMLSPWLLHARRFSGERLWKGNKKYAWYWAPVNRDSGLPVYWERLEQKWVELTKDIEKATDTGPDPRRDELRIRQLGRMAADFVVRYDESRAQICGKVAVRFCNVHMFSVVVEVKDPDFFKQMADGFAEVRRKLREKHLKDFQEWTARGSPRQQKPTIHLWDLCQAAQQQDIYEFAPQLTKRLLQVPQYRPTYMTLIKEGWIHKPTSSVFYEAIVDGPATGRFAWIEKFFKQLSKLRDGRNQIPKVAFFSNNPFIAWCVNLFCAYKLQKRVAYVHAGLNMRKRGQIVHGFNRRSNDDDGIPIPDDYRNTDCFVASSGCAGVGLNLLECAYQVQVDIMPNADTQFQVACRLRRLNQKATDVYLYRLRTQGGKVGEVKANAIDRQADILQLLFDGDM